MGGIALVFYSESEHLEWKILVTTMRVCLNTLIFYRFCEVLWEPKGVKNATFPFLTRAVPFSPRPPLPHFLPKGRYPELNKRERFSEPVAASRNWKALYASDRSWREWCGWSLGQIPPPNDAFVKYPLQTRYLTINEYISDDIMYWNIIHSIWQYFMIFEHIWGNLKMFTGTW